MSDCDTVDPVDEELVAAADDDDDDAGDEEVVELVIRVDEALELVVLADDVKACGEDDRERDVETDDGVVDVVTRVEEEELLDTPDEELVLLVVPEVDVTGTEIVEEEEITTVTLVVPEEVVVGLH